MENKSKYDPTRKTVGAIYRDAQMASHDAFVENGDLTHELQKSLCDDLNTTFASNPYEGKSFYVTVHEKKDLQMPRAILRRMITTKYRPAPEDDTIVFFCDPSSNNIRFCWCLPHWSEMDNMLANQWLYEPEMIEQIKAHKRDDWHHFGFVRNAEGNWEANPRFEDKRLDIKAPIGCKILLL